MSIFPKKIRYRGQIYEQILSEARQDEINFRNAVGNNLADIFYKLQPRMSSPENDVYYWIKQGKDKLSYFLSSLQQVPTRKEKEEQARQGAEKVYSDDNWTVFKITSYEASKQYGKDTKWCITGSKEANTNGLGGEYWWNNYTNDMHVQFYFYFDKKNNTKYAVAVYPTGEPEVFNATDAHIAGIPNAPQIKGIPNVTVEEFVLKDNGTKLIKYNGGKTIVQVPDGIKIIGIEAFSEADWIKEIILPESIIEIQSGAFYHLRELEKINLPTRLSYIGGRAFQGCNKLSKITLPNTVRAIGGNCFAYCQSLSEIVLSSKMSYIPMEAFNFCRELKSVTIPKSISRIDYGAFFDCRSLAEIHYGGTVEEFKQISTSDSFLNELNDGINIFVKIYCTDAVVELSDL